MRQVLFHIPWDGFAWGDRFIPLFGRGVLLALWILWGIAWLCRKYLQREAWNGADAINLMMWCGISWLLLKAPEWGPRLSPNGIPIFGYGFMLFWGMIAAISLATYRAPEIRIRSETIWDLAVWLFLSGIVGARAFFLVQYGSQVYTPGQSWAERLLATVNLSQGGIVFYGGALCGALAHFVYCRIKNVPALDLADVITPSVFVGMGFGRIGCFLNGCCYGDFCSQPWCVSFPAESVPWYALVQRGLLAPDALQTPPLQPTQLYSAFDGFFLAALTWWLFPYRTFAGEILGVGLIVSALTRFLIEFVRGDEFGQFGTSLTISQWISLSLGTMGVILLLRGTMNSRRAYERQGQGRTVIETNTTVQ